MAGHSKWSNIKHRKGAQDKKRGKIFTKLIREINVAARAGGGDADTNPRLRLAVDKALSNNMPKDNIDRAIKRATGGDDSEHYEEVTYEGYGPGGVAIMVECLTENKNRTVGEVRHAFSKRGGNLGADGSVAYLFSRAGVISYGPDIDDETVLEVALEAGAEDTAEYDDGAFDVLTTPETFTDVKQALEQAGHTPALAEVTMRPSIQAEPVHDDAEKCLKLIDMLEDLDDVQNVYTNAEFPEDVLAANG